MSLWGLASAYIYSPFECQVMESTKTIINFQYTQFECNVIKSIQISHKLRSEYLIKIQLSYTQHMSNNLETILRLPRSPRPWIFVSTSTEVLYLRGPSGRWSFAFQASQFYHCVSWLGGSIQKNALMGYPSKKHLVSKCSFIHIVQMKFNCVTHIQCKDSISFSGKSHIQPTGRSSRLGAIRRWFFGRWYNSLDCYMLLCQFIRLSSCYTLHWLEK